MCIQEPTVVCTTPYIDVASTSRKSSGAKRPRISSGSRDTIEFSMIPNLHLLNGNLAAVLKRFCVKYM